MQLNDVGDLIVEDPESLRALADPRRLTLIDRLRRGEPVEAADLPHLEELERLGFVTNDGDRWSAVGRGIYFEIPEERAGQAAAHDLALPQAGPEGVLEGLGVQPHLPLGDDAAFVLVDKFDRVLDGEDMVAPGPIDQVHQLRRWVSAVHRPR